MEYKNQSLVNVDSGRAVNPDQLEIVRRLADPAQANQMTGWELEQNFKKLGGRQRAGQIVSEFINGQSKSTYGLRPGEGG